LTIRSGKWLIDKQFQQQRIRRHRCHYPLLTQQTAKLRAVGPEHDKNQRQIKTLRGKNR
jgi:hypothetical protein